MCPELWEYSLHIYATVGMSSVMKLDIAVVVGVAMGVAWLWAWSGVGVSTGWVVSLTMAEASFRKDRPG